MENNDNLNVALLKTISNIYKNKENDWEKIIEYFKQGVSPNIKIGEKETTPLIIAVRNQRKDLCNCLLNLNAYINGCDAFGKTALHILISEFKQNPKTISIEYLLRNGSNPNLIDAWGNTPLSTATKRGRDLDFIIPLIQYRAQVNPEFSTYSPLGWTIHHNQFHVLKILYKNGALLYNIDKEKNTVFHAIVSKQTAPTTIGELITYPHVNYTQQELQQLNKTIIEILWIFKNLNNRNNFPKIDKDLQFRILSKLPIAYFYANKNLYTILSDKGYKLLFPQVYNHLHYLKKILQTKNIYKETVLDLLDVHPNKYIHNVEPFLNIHQLQEDFKNLINAQQKISENNVALQIYNNYEELLLSNRLKIS